MAKLDIVDGKLVRRDNKPAQEPLPQPPVPQQRQETAAPRFESRQEQYIPQQEEPQFSEEELKAAYEKKLMEEYMQKEAEERKSMLDAERARQANMVSFHVVIQGDRQLDFGVSRQDANVYNQTLQRAMERDEVIQIGNRIINAKHITTYWFD